MAEFNREEIIKALECFHQRILNTNLAEKITETEIMAIIDTIDLIKQLTEEKRQIKERVGKWRPTSPRTGFSLEGYMFCSKCDVMIHTCDDNYYCLSKLNYCPMCGARMKGE